MSEPYYQDEHVTLYHGDCREVLPSLSERVDVTITSPPYNIGDMTGGYANLANGYHSWRDTLPHHEYVAMQRSVLQECWRLSQLGIFYNHKPRIKNGVLWTPLELAGDLPLRQIVIWDRGSGMNWSHTHFVGRQEWILVYAKEAMRWSKDVSSIGDVWRFAPAIGEAERLGHPAPFPPDLPARVLTITSAQSILDPFAGSGTALRVAKDYGRRAIGVEIEERYCEIAARRLSQGVLEVTP